MRSTMTVPIKSTQAFDTGRFTRSKGLIGICLLSLAARTANASGEQTPALMDQQSEIALALSACPPLVASKAAVYVLGKAGYIKIRESQNGFTALVQHSLPTAVEPQCMDAVGTRTLLGRMLKVAELRAQGLSPDEIKRAIADAFAKGALQAPSRPGVDYMLSTANVVPDDKGVLAHFPPHVLGSDGQGGAGPFFVAGGGTPFALVIVPVGAHTGPAHTSEDSK
jgi:hypothetical protein